MAADFPNVPSFRRNLAKGRHEYAIFLRTGRQHAQAQSQIKAALEILERLTVELPEVTGCRFDLGNAQMELGVILTQAGELATAQTWLQQALRTLDGASPEFAAAPTHRETLAKIHTNLAANLLDQKRYEAMDRHYRAAIAIQERLVEENPHLPRYRLGHSATLINQGHFLREQGQFEKALKFFRMTEKMLKPPPGAELPATPTREYLSSTHLGAAWCLESLRRPDEAEDHWRRFALLSEPGQEYKAKITRALLRVRMGHALAAVREAEALGQSAQGGADLRYNIACVCSLAAEQALDERQAETFKAKAMAWLEKAQQEGDFRGNPPLKRGLSEDADLNPLRDREEFKKLAADVARDQGPGAASVQGAVERRSAAEGGSEGGAGQKARQLPIAPAPRKSGTGSDDR
ncbi:MAG TPA: tetratricopeptide repeat protein [Planctomycetia bacterium]|nr:tetratricopeptide repeat protein [Planctomycetia bacterium]